MYIGSRSLSENTCTIRIQEPEEAKTSEPSLQSHMAGTLLHTVKSLITACKWLYSTVRYNPGLW